MDGGIFWLLGLISRHRGALEYDFRSRFHLGLRDIGTVVSIDEAARLALILADDPGAMTAAALAGWSHPLSREALILADLFDLQHFAKASKPPKPYPRPWPTSGQMVKQKGDAAGRSREEVIEILRTQFGRE